MRTLGLALMLGCALTAAAQGGNEGIPLGPGGDTLLNTTYCPENGVDSIFLYVSTDGMPLIIAVCQGDPGAGCTAQLSSGGASPFPQPLEGLAGHTVTAMSGVMVVHVQCDGQSDCAEGDGLPLMWTVVWGGLGPPDTYEFDMLCSWSGLTTGVQGQAGMEAPRLFPVPADSWLHVPLSTDGKVFQQAVVRDMQGRSWFRRPVPDARELELDVSALPAGSYFLELVGQEGRRVERFQVLH